MSAALQSCLYEGWVRHRRRTPVLHRFRYRMYMACLDLDEMESESARGPITRDRGVLAVFRRCDDLVEAETGQRPDGPIRLLTHLACFGHRFNPVSFYYCFDSAGTVVKTVVAEINNTPWGEQHCYVLSVPSEGRLSTTRFGLKKDFHVSPFMPMDQSYRWRFTSPEDRLAVHMVNIDAQGQDLFDASLSLRRQPLTTMRLGLALLRFPLMTVQVMAAIYWQAFRLWSKRCPIFPHPGSQQPTPNPPTPAAGT